VQIFPLPPGSGPGGFQLPAVLLSPVLFDRKSNGFTYRDGKPVAKDDIIVPKKTPIKDNVASEIARQKDPNADGVYYDVDSLMDNELDAIRASNCLTVGGRRLSDVLDKIYKATKTFSLGSTAEAIPLENRTEAYNKLVAEMNNLKTVLFPTPKPKVPRGTKAVKTQHFQWFSATE